MSSLEIVVVTFSSWKTAQAELRVMANLAAEQPAARWCFVDNSVDNSDLNQLRPLLDSCSNTRLISLPNPGFAAACNEAARTSSASWILFLNPDITISSVQLNQVIELCTRKNEDRRPVALSMVTNGRHHCGISLLFGMWFIDAILGPRQRVIGPSGGAGLFPRELFQEYAGFYEALFAWGEDADLAWRMSRAGIVTDVEIVGLIHQGGHSVSSQSGSSATFKVRNLYRNRLIVAHRNMTAPGFFSFVLIYGVILVLLAPKNFARRSFAASIVGFYDGIRAACFGLEPL